MKKKTRTARTTAQAQPEEAPEVEFDGDLPEGWGSIPLRDAGRWGSGGTPSKAKDVFWTNGTVPWISPKDMKSPRLADAQDHVTRAAIAATNLHLLPPGTVLFVVRGMILARSFPVALTTVNATINQDIRYIISNERVNPEFLALALRRDEYHILVAVKEATHGTLRLESETLQNWRVPLPPVAEQKRIVAKVEEVLASVNASRDHLARVPALLKRFRQSVLAAACSGRLTEEWRHTHTNSDLQGGQASGDAVSDADVELPPSWKWAAARSLCDPTRALTYGVIKLGPPVAGGVPTLRSSDVRPLFIDIADVKRISPNIANDYSRTTLRGGEVLVTVRGTLGGVGVSTVEMAGWNVSREVAVLPVLTERCWPHYLAAAVASTLCQKWLNERAKGVAYTGINIEDLKELPVPAPPVREQHEIVRRVDALFALADSIERRVADATVRATALTQATLAKAFRGELVPTEAELAR